MDDSVSRKNLTGKYNIKGTPCRVVANKSLKIKQRDDLSYHQAVGDTRGASLCFS
jgi:hypothetical protein